MSFKWNDIPEARRESIERGVIAIRKINERETFHSWMQIGQSLNDAQQAAMILANTNNPKGRAYNDAYKMIGEEVPDLVNINKTTRSHAIEMAKQREAVEAWHATLPLNIQQEVNHPSTVWRRFSKRNAATTNDDNKEKPVTLSQKKDAEITRLQEEVDIANRKIRQFEKGDSGPLVTRNATAEEANRILAEYFGPSKWSRITGIGLGKQKSTVPQPKQLDKPKTDSAE